MPEALHRLRHWLWMWLWYFDPVAAHVAAWCRAGSRCFRCGTRLDADERQYYETSCERCEGIEFHRLSELEREHFGDPDKGTGIYAQEVCRFPVCKCPMDPGPELDWCARGLPHASGTLNDQKRGA